MVSKNIVNEKKKQLVKLQKKADSSLNLVTSTIRSLSIVNEKIDVTVSEIEAAEAELSATKSELQSTKERNTKIVDKFNQLLEA